MLMQILINFLYSICFIWLQCRFIIFFVFSLALISYICKYVLHVFMPKINKLIKIIIITRGLEFVTSGFQVVTHELELVTRGFELVARNSQFVFYFSTKKEPPKKPERRNVKEFNKLNTKKNGTSRELFQKLFKFQRPIAMLKDLNNTDKKKNDGLMNVIKGRLSDLKDEIEKMSEDEIEIEKSYEIVDIFEKILEFNKQGQEGKVLKVLTPDQMLSILPISLAQLKAENNS